MRKRTYTRRSYTEQEAWAVLSLIDTLGPSQIAQKIGNRSTASIRHFCWKHKVRKGMIDKEKRECLKKYLQVKRNDFTREEHEYMRENWRKLSIDSIAKHLGRTTRRISQEAHYMGISKKDVIKNPIPRNYSFIRDWKIQDLKVVATMMDKEDRAIAIELKTHTSRARSMKRMLNAGAFPHIYQPSAHP